MNERRRLGTGAGVVAGHVAVIAALALMGSERVQRAATDALTVVNIAAPLPPAPEPPKAAERPAAKEGERARRARPTPVISPARPEPSEAPVARAAAEGVQTAAGAAQDGAGTGAGNAGIGTGSGLGGTGGGGGTRARLVAGAIRDRDYPRPARPRRASGSVDAHYDIGPDGRPFNCRVARSSGDPDLDATTCRLILERFRYQPATDAYGRATTDVAGWRQQWWWEPGGG